MNFEINTKKSAQLFNDSYLLKCSDIKCITNHPNLKSTVLLHENLYTAMVGMHDRESSYLPARNKVPDKCAFSLLSVIIVVTIRQGKKRTGQDKNKTGKA